MKDKKRRIIFISAVAVVICVAVALIIIEKNKVKSKYGTVSETDYAVNGTVNTDKVCYFVNGGFLTIYDKENMKTAVFCGNARCKHNEGCSARLQNAELVEASLSYCDGELYYLEMGVGKLNVKKIAMDATAVDSVVTVFEYAADNEVQFTDTSLMTMGGYAYLTISELDAATAKNRYSRLYRVKLEKDAVPELITSVENINSMIRICGKENNRLYYSLSYLDDAETAYFVIDTQTGTNTKLMSFEGVGELVCMGENLYVSSENGIYKTDMNGKNEKIINDDNGISNLCLSEKYLIVFRRDENGVYSAQVLDLEGKIMAEGEFTEEVLTVEPVSAGEDIFVKTISYDSDKLFRFNVEEAVNSGKIVFTEDE